MRKVSGSQWIGVVVIALLAACGIGVFVARANSSLNAPGLTLQEAFPQAPGIPPPPQSRHLPGASAFTAPRVPAASAAAKPAAPTIAMQNVPETVPPVGAKVAVHVAGAVKKPGVYYLPAGVRGDDALKAAGGPKPDANTDAVNLAARVEDGSQLYFPTRQQQTEGGAHETPAPAALPQASTRQDMRKRTGSKPPSPLSHAKSDKLTDPRQGTVNINTANGEELQRLPGIGPSMAERILAFRRENHGFQTAEDLMNVSGIGEKKFAKMQAFVRVR